MSVAERMDLRALHDRLGRVGNQPIRVTSFTNKRFTVNYRVPVAELRRIVPEAIEIDEIRDTGFGMFSMCACDFWVTRLGMLPVIPIRNNDMLLRVSAKVRKGPGVYRAYYTLRSDSSSRFLGFCGAHFSHFRKNIAEFVREDDGAYYALRCRPKDPMCHASFRAEMDSITKHKPEGTLFGDIREATDFVFQLDGSCGYSYERDMLSFQKIEYPPWDISFCHAYSYDFPLMDFICTTFDLHPTLDCVLSMQDVPQVWGSSRLYRNPPS
jgi:hypothetical protein